MTMRPDGSPQRAITKHQFYPGNPDWGIAPYRAQAILDSARAHERIGRHGGRSHHE
jgi:hypothetical protein